MTRILAIVELVDQPTEPIDLNGVISITPIQDFPIDAIPDGAALIAHWNAGVQARHSIEAVAENFYQLFRKSGIVDEAGLHVKEYTPGSLVRFLDRNQEMMMSKSFRDSATGLLVATSLKSAKALLGKKGKEIDMDWSFILEHGKPMIETILRQMLLSPQRWAIIMPVIAEFFEPSADQPALPTATDGK